MGGPSDRAGSRLRPKQTPLPLAPNRPAGGVPTRTQSRTGCTQIFKLNRPKFPEMMRLESRGGGIFDLRLRADVRSACSRTRSVSVFRGRCAAVGSCRRSRGALTWLRPIQFSLSTASCSRVRFCILPQKVPRRLCREISDRSIGETSPESWTKRVNTQEWTALRHPSEGVCWMWSRDSKCPLRVRLSPVAV